MVQRCHHFHVVGRVQVALVRDLVLSVTVADLSQENICCLNTALVILLFAHRRGQLPSFLQVMTLYARSFSHHITTSYSTHIHTHSFIYFTHIHTHTRTFTQSGTHKDTRHPVDLSVMIAEDMSENPRMSGT